MTLQYVSDVQRDFMGLTADCQCWTFGPLAGDLVEKIVGLRCQGIAALTQVLAEDPGADLVCNGAGLEGRLGCAQLRKADREIAVGVTLVDVAWRQAFLYGLLDEEI